MITIRKMESFEAGRISEIDRTEHVTQDCRVKNGSLEIIDVDWWISPWDSKKKIEEWTPIAEGYQNMWGAFDKEKLVGFAVYRSRLADDMAQFAILHVSHGYRRMGIGKRLSEEVIKKAKADGKRRIYVSSAPTKATVDFYQKLGFRLAEQVNDELYKLEPDDIHMILELT